jgi:hypothetical protein
MEMRRDVHFPTDRLDRRPKGTLSSTDIIDDAATVLFRVLQILSVTDPLLACFGSPSGCSSP